MAFSKIHSEHRLGNLVFWEAPYRQRLVEAIGPNVIKFLEDFGSDVFSSPSATTWVETKVAGTCGVASYPIEGGGVFLYSNGSDNHGYEMQKMAGFVAVDDCPIYFGVRWKLLGIGGLSASVVLGLLDEDTSVVETPNTGIVFTIPSAAANLDFVCYSTLTGVAMTALTAVLTDTWYTNEFYWDGADQIKMWHNGAYIGAASTASIAQTSAMAITIAFQNEAENASGTTGLLVDWIRAVQLLDVRNV